jgi:DNA modification methylase
VSRKANAQVSGGGGWAAMNDQMAASRAALLGVSVEEVKSSGTSIFDPVLCELIYRWFCPPGGTVLDPFAGGSVRGVVASKLGFPYIGVELRAEQVAANMAQGMEICGVPAPRWVTGDSREVLPHMAQGDEPVSADLIFSCPPYADLEVYSDDPRDLSTYPYPKFRRAYSEIIVSAAALLKPNRFACFVVGDARGKDGFYYGLPWHTIEAFESAGCRLYNESVLVTSVGSLPIRVTKQFNVSRKLGKTHQNILVFLKGDPRKAAEACGGADGD